MKLTFPILTLNRGGAQRVLVEIVNGLVRKGHQVTVLMPAYGAVEFYPVLAKIVRVKNLTAEAYPVSDVIVSNFYTTVPSAQAASNQGKGIHVRMSLCYEPVFLPENQISFPTYHATDKMIVLSEWQRRLMALIHGVQGKLVPVGVCPVFHNLGLRNQLRRTVISAMLRKPEGGFSVQRDQDYLLRELNTVKKLHPNVQIQLICPPSEAADSPFIQSICADKRYKVYTPKSDLGLARLYSKSHIFVTASVFETANLVALEAMKCGAALVTTYSGANMDNCKSEINCLLSYRHQNRLAQDVMRLLNDPGLRNKIALEGEKEASKWTWQRSVNQFEEAILEMTKDKGKRPSERT